MLLLATRNRHKAEEIRAILGPAFRYLTLNDFPAAPAVIEDADSFAGNATKKAVELARWAAAHWPECDKPKACFVVADDSGLEVDALDGAPGVHSARFAATAAGGATNSPDAANNAKLLHLLEDLPSKKRSARFRCVIALAPVTAPAAESFSPVCSADEIELRTELFDGVCEGEIAIEPRGQGGFGYDPLFRPRGHEQSFAELGEEVKNRISHRARALQQLQQRLSLT